MKITAIIAEYNPFHNGHQYQIQQTRRQTGADFILAVMSGDFVQRGAPAFCSKYIRTQMALACGVDAVIELPALYALSSAEFFAGGAVTLLKQLNVINTLSFGSESGELTVFTDCARLLAQNSSLLQAQIKEKIKSGCPYPAALEQAVSEFISQGGGLGIALSGFFGAPGSSLDSAKIHAFFSSPNNILGLAYCKALYAAYGLKDDGIRPFTLKRKGGGYHDLSPSEKTSFLSASAIRNILSSSTPGGSALESVRQYVPNGVFDLLIQNNLLTAPVTEDDFSGLLHYKLLSEQEKGFTDYLDCDKNLSDKICKSIPDFTDFTGFCSLLKSKDITYAHISRVLMHILLDIKTPDFFKAPLPERELFVPYARLLGFRQTAAPLLNAIKKSSIIPLLSKPADARFLLSKEAYTLLEQDFFCASVYESVVSRCQKRPSINEIKQSPIIFPTP